MTIDVERRYREALEQARDRLQSISAHVHPLDEMTESDLNSISQDWWFGTQEIEIALDRAAEYGTPASQETALREALDYDQMRRDRGWPTPNHMRRIAGALDEITPAKYSDVLR